MNKQSRKHMKANAMKILRFQGIRRWRVLFLVNKRERKSPWFYSHERAQKAFDILTAKYGKRSAIIYVD